MFSMKIGLAAFDQPGQLNRPFNYPIRYIYISQPRKSSPRRANDRPKLIGVAHGVSFAIQLRQDDGTRSFARWRFSDRSRFIGGRASILVAWNNTPFVTNRPVLRDIHRVNLIRSLYRSLKNNRCSFHLDQQRLSTTMVLDTISSTRSTTTDRFNIILFTYFIFFFLLAPNSSLLNESKLLCVVTWTVDRSMIQPRRRRWQWAGRFAANSSAPATTYAISRSPSGRPRSPPPRSG